jgi:hypothetical protein
MCGPNTVLSFTFLPYMNRILDSKAKKGICQGRSKAILTFGPSMEVAPLPHPENKRK